MKRTRRLLLPIAVCLGMVALVSASLAGEAADEPQPVTTSDPSIPTEELERLLKPLSKEELLLEAEGWRKIVKAKAEEIARAEIAVQRQTKEIEKAEEIKEQAEEAQKELEKVAEKVEEAKASGDAEVVAEAEEAAAEAREKMRGVSESVDESVEAAKKTAEIKEELSVETRQDLSETAAAAEKAEEAVGDVHEAVESAAGKSGEAARQATEQAEQATTEAQAATEDVRQKIDETLAHAKKAEALQEAAATVEEVAEQKEQKKIDRLERVTQLREERTQLLDNMRAVIDELESKTHADDSDTLAKIKDYRLYLSAVSGIHVDVTDTTSALVSLKGWATSEEGGLRWLINIATFLGILILAWFVSRLLSGMVRRATTRMSLPMLLRDFLIKSVRWVVMIIGVIWALTALEVSIAPLLAVVGAAGFIIAFAMQESLSNFASGLMILFFRPFDTGDVVDAGGVSGTVSSMNLVSTTIKTFDNKLMVVPNSKIWRDVITNATGVTERRVDMEFGISYEADIDQALQILEEIVNSHPKVLKEPAPTIKMNALADSSVNFICRPWAKTADYWTVYWDIMKAVKKRFDAAGIGIPFPQRDVHLHIVEHPDKEKAEAIAGKGAGSKAHPAEPEHKDGGLDG